MTADDAAGLGSRRRGVEPLRILVCRSGSTRMTVGHAPRDRTDAGGDLMARATCDG